MTHARGKPSIFFQLASTGVVQIDPGNGRFVRVNATFCRLLGYSEAELLSLGYQALRHPEEPPDVAGRGPVTRFVRKDGGVVWLELDSATVEEDAQPFLVVVAHDVTEREQMKARFRRTFDPSPMPFTISRLADGTVLEVNDSALEVFGFTREQVVGQRMAELGVQSRLLTDRVVFAQRLRERRSLRNVELSVTLASGRTLHILSAYEVVELDGEDVLLSMFLDMTERRVLEREIIDISACEQRRIAGDLHDSVQQHLIGTAMLAKRLAAVAKEQAPELADALHELYTLIREGTEHVRTVLGGITSLQPHANGLMVALESMCQRVSSLFGTPCRFRFDQPLLVYDPERATHLYHIAHEAAINAARHAGASLIDVRLMRAEASYVLSVTDDGTGMGGDMSGRREGMGLNLMEYRARLMGRRLEITTALRQGTTVTCFFGGHDQARSA